MKTYTLELIHKEAKELFDAEGDIDIKVNVGNC